MRRLKVAHLITQLELGGAQQNTLYTVAHLDRDRFEPILVAGSGGLLEAQARAVEGLHFETCPHLARPVAPGRDLLALADLRRRLQRLAPQIVHTHSSKAGILGRLAAVLAGVPIIVHTVHGWGFTPLQSILGQRIFVSLERFAAQLSTQLVAVSRANALEGQRRKIAAAEAFEVIYSGIEIDRFETVAEDETIRRRARQALGLPAEAPLAGMIACLKPQKAPLDYVLVAERVRREVPGAHFLLAGDGELRAAVEAEVGSRGLEGRFHLLGWRRDPEQVLAAIDVLVLTSRHEGLPRVIPEAMAAGRPVVVTAVDGSPEAVEEGETGFLAEAGDVERLARGVTALLADPRRARAMGRRARRRVEAWNIDTMVRRQESLYLTLARQAGIPAGEPER
ncbi:MAG: glycosyltransferase family 4 protein [Acidobacteriota bacterium]|nr:glycosyltransferase family 4 protein [Acidobacteriota bacterium]